MNKLATRLQAAIAKNQKRHPEAIIGLNFGANDDELAQLELLIGAILPEDFKTVYRQHNGQLEDGANVFNGEEWLSLERIAEEWTLWKKRFDKQEFATLAGVPTDDGIRAVWWTPLWLPFSADGAGNHLCLDLNPSSSGRYGQIVRVWQDDAERSLDATSFEEWLDAYVEGLEESDFIYSEECDAIIDADELYLDDDEEEDESLLSDQERELRQKWRETEAQMQDSFSAIFDEEGEFDLKKVGQLMDKSGLFEALGGGQWDELKNLLGEGDNQNKTDDDDVANDEENDETASDEVSEGDTHQNASKRKH